MCFTIVRSSWRTLCSPGATLVVTPLRFIAAAVTAKPRQQDALHAIKGEADKPIGHGVLDRELATTGKTPRSKASHGRDDQRPKRLDQAPNKRRGDLSSQHASELYDTDGTHVINGLPELAAVVERHVGRWAETRSVHTFRAAFSIVGKLGTASGADLSLARSTIKVLSAAYLPLVPGLESAFACIIPLWACAKLGYWEGRLATELFWRLIEGELLQAATGQNHANLWWAVSRAPSEVAAMSKDVLELSALHLLGMAGAQLESRHWSNVLLSCARLQWGDDPALLHHVTACLAAHPRADHQHLANGLYSLGELAQDCRHQPLPKDLQLLAGRVVARLGQSRVRQEKGQRNQGSSSRRSTFLPQELSIMLLGCAKLGYRSMSLLEPLSAAAAEAAPHMSGQNLANSLYGLAKLGCTDAQCTPSVQALYSEARQRLLCAPGSFAPQELSNMIWALEALRPPHWHTYADALAAACRELRFAGFKSQELSNCVWALAKLGWTEDQAWYEAAVAAAMQPGVMAGAKPQEWATFLYGLALVQHRPHEGLMWVMAAGGGQQGGSGRGAVKGPIDVLRTSADSQACVNLLWSLAVLGLYEQRLVDVLARRLGELLQRGSGHLAKQALANSLWAFAVMGPNVLRRHSGLVEGLLREAVRRWQSWDLDFLSAKEGLAQLWQVQQELADVGGGLDRILTAPGSCESRGDCLATEARSAAEGRGGVSVFSASQLEKEVMGTLRSMQVQGGADGNGATERAGGIQPGAAVSEAGVIVSIHTEFPVEGLCSRVDVVLELVGGRWMALEVDGPSHFLANSPHTHDKDGATLLRDRQLERVFGPGNVVSVPYWEWMDLRTNAVRQEYLRRLLAL